MSFQKMPGIASPASQRGLSGAQRGLSGAQRGLSGAQRGLSGARRGLSAAQRGLCGGQRGLWRPKNEDRSSKMKRFGSNLFNLMELSSFFGRNRVPGGFQGVLRAAGTFFGQNPARKNIESRIDSLVSHSGPY